MHFRSRFTKCLAKRDAWRTFAAVIIWRTSRTHLLPVQLESRKSKDSEAPPDIIQSAYRLTYSRRGSGIFLARTKHAAAPLWMGHATRDCVLRGVNFNVRYVQSEGRPLAGKRIHSYGRQTEIDADAVGRVRDGDIPRRSRESAKRYVKRPYKLRLSVIRDDWGCILSRQFRREAAKGNVIGRAIKMRGIQFTTFA